jgi:hypothetical protein
MKKQSRLLAVDVKKLTVTKLDLKKPEKKRFRVKPRPGPRPSIPRVTKQQMRKSFSQALRKAPHFTAEQKAKLEANKDTLISIAQKALMKSKAFPRYQAGVKRRFKAAVKRSKKRGFEHLPVDPTAHDLVPNHLWWVYCGCFWRIFMKCVHRCCPGEGDCGDDMAEFSCLVDCIPPNLFEICPLVCGAESEDCRFWIRPLCSWWAKQGFDDYCNKEGDNYEECLERFEDACVDAYCYGR